MTIHNPHDRFFRESFGRLEIARNYLEEYLPVPVQNLLNLDTLTLQQGSFIDPAMQEHHTDLIYQVELNTGDPAYIYFLFEHKSYPDRLVALQLLRYMVQFWVRGIFDPNLREELTDLVRLMFQLGQKRTGLEYIRTILYYLSQATERIKREDLQTVLLEEAQQGEETMATIAQEFIQMGIEQGRRETQRDIARRLLKMHNPITVSELTQLPLEEVLALQDETE